MTLADKLLQAYEATKKDNSALQDDLGGDARRNGTDIDADRLAAWAAELETPEGRKKFAKIVQMEKQTTNNLRKAQLAAMAADPIQGKGAGLDFYSKETKRWSSTSTAEDDEYKTDAAELNVLDISSEMSALANIASNYMHITANPEDIAELESSIKYLYKQAKKEDATRAQSTDGRINVDAYKDHVITKCLTFFVLSGGLDTQLEDEVDYYDEVLKAITAATTGRVINRAKALSLLGVTPKTYEAIMPFLKKIISAEFDIDIDVMMNSVQQRNRNLIESTDPDGILQKLGQSISTGILDLTVKELLYALPFLFDLNKEHKTPIYSENKSKYTIAGLKAWKKEIIIDLVKKGKKSQEIMSRLIGEPVFSSQKPAKESFGIALLSETFDDDEV